LQGFIITHSKTRKPSEKSYVGLLLWWEGTSGWRVKEQEEAAQLHLSLGSAYPTTWMRISNSWPLTHGQAAQMLIPPVRGLFTKRGGRLLWNLDTREAYEL
jgi:hypothetical protein